MEKRFDIKNKIVLITGATDGIGRETAYQLAKKKAIIIIHGIDLSKLKKTADEIKKGTGNNNMDFIKGDLSSLNEIKEMSNRIKERYDKIDILINNGGLFSHDKRLSVDGFELTFAVNYLSHFYLTFLLFDIIKKIPQARIINVSSMAHSSDLDFNNIQGEEKYSGYTAYSYSKLLNILFTFELAEKTKNSGITVNCLHPGVINTKLLREGWGLGGDSVSEGAKTTVYLASSNDVNGITGKYFTNSSVSEPAQISYDKEIRKKVWQLSEKLLGINWETQL
jgi:NAD(P)-dependent dehydrogenase (short-subunit alcohol dehydrogenase family)